MRIDRNQPIFQIFLRNVAIQRSLISSFAENDKRIKKTIYNITITTITRRLLLHAMKKEREREREVNLFDPYDELKFLLQIIKFSIDINSSNLEFNQNFTYYEHLSVLLD